MSYDLLLESEYQINLTKKLDKERIYREKIMSMGQNAMMLVSEVELMCNLISMNIMQNYPMIALQTNVYHKECNPKLLEIFDLNLKKIHV